MHVPCDLLVGIAGKNLLMEVKDGSRPPSGQKLTDTQVKLRNTWRGQFAVVKSVDEALAVVKAERWK